MGPHWRTILIADRWNIERFQVWPCAESRIHVEIMFCLRRFGVASQKSWRNDNHFHRCRLCSTLRKEQTIPTLGCSRRRRRRRLTSLHNLSSKSGDLLCDDCIAIYATRMYFHPFWARYTSPENRQHKFASHTANILLFESPPKRKPLVAYAREIKKKWKQTGFQSKTKRAQPDSEQYQQQRDTISASTIDRSGTKAQNGLDEVFNGTGMRR